MAQSKMFYVEFTVEILKHLNTSKALKGHIYRIVPPFSVKVDVTIKS